MTAEDLIKILQQYPPGTQVLIAHYDDDEWEPCYYYEPEPVHVYANPDFLRRVRAERTGIQPGDNVLTL